MIKYKKLRIKNEEEVEELDIDDIEPINSLNFRVPFFATKSIATSAMYISDDPIKSKMVRLSTRVDWIIRKYKGDLYLIPLKKDC